jgi:hypothetical protein
MDGKKAATVNGASVTIVKDGTAAYADGATVTATDKLNG